MERRTQGRPSVLVLLVLLFAFFIITLGGVDAVAAAAMWPCNGDAGAAAVTLPSDGATLPKHALSET